MMVNSGPGAFEVRDWRDLWATVFRVLAYAIGFDQTKTCMCGCKVAECDYCAHECGPDYGEPRPGWIATSDPLAATVSGGKLFDRGDGDYEVRIDHLALTERDLELGFVKRRKEPR